MASHIEHRKGGWYVVYPAAPDEGMDTERGPYLTRVGARLARWVWGD